MVGSQQFPPSCCRGEDDQFTQAPNIFRGSTCKRFACSRATLLPPRTNYEPKSEIIPFICVKVTPPAAVQMRCNLDNQSNGLRLANKTEENLLLFSHSPSLKCSFKDPSSRFEFSGGRGQSAAIHINPHVLRGHAGQYGMRDFFASRSLWQISCITGNNTNSSTSLVETSTTPKQGCLFYGQAHRGAWMMPIISYLSRWAEI